MTNTSLEIQRKPLVFLLFSEGIEIEQGYGMSQQKCPLLTRLSYKTRTATKTFFTFILVKFR